MSNSKLESKFLSLLFELAPALKVVREFRAIPGRRFAFDFFLPDYGILIEIQGGAFTGGRHTRGAGMASDCEKSRLAQMMGYKCFAYTGNQITREHVQELVNYVQQKP